VTRVDPLRNLPHEMAGAAMALLEAPHKAVSVSACVCECDCVSEWSHLYLHIITSLSTPFRLVLFIFSPNLQADEALIKCPVCDKNNIANIDEHLTVCSLFYRLKLQIGKGALTNYYGEALIKYAEYCTTVTLKPLLPLFANALPHAQAHVRAQAHAQAHKHAQAQAHVRAHVRAQAHVHAQAQAQEARFPYIMQILIDSLLTTLTRLGVALELDKVVQTFLSRAHEVLRQVPKTAAEIAEMTDNAPRRLAFGIDTPDELFSLRPYQLNGLDVLAINTLGTKHVNKNVKSIFLRTVQTLALLEVLLVIAGDNQQQLELDTLLRLVQDSREASRRAAAEVTAPLNYDESNMIAALVIKYFPVLAFEKSLMPQVIASIENIWIGTGKPHGSKIISCFYHLFSAAQIELKLGLVSIQSSNIWCLVDMVDAVKKVGDTRSVQLTKSLEMLYCVHNIASRGIGVKDGKPDRSFGLPNENTRKTFFDGINEQVQNIIENSLAIHAEQLSKQLESGGKYALQLLACGITKQNIAQKLESLSSFFACQHVPGAVGRHCYLAHCSQQVSVCPCASNIKATEDEGMCIVEGSVCLVDPATNTNVEAWLKKNELVIKLCRSLRLSVPYKPTSNGNGFFDYPAFKKLCNSYASYDDDDASHTTVVWILLLVREMFVCYCFHEHVARERLAEIHGFLPKVVTRVCWDAVYALQHPAENPALEPTQTRSSKRKADQVSGVDSENNGTAAAAAAATLLGLGNVE